MLAMLLGTHGDSQALQTEVTSVHIRRVVIKRQSKEGDAGLCLRSVRRMRKAARAVIGNEFQAILWERTLPTAGLLQEKKITKPLEIGVLATVDAAYESGMTDEEKIRTVFEAVKCGDDINRYFYDLQAVVAKAVADYRGRFNKWDWAASRMIVMQAGLPVKAYAKVLGVDLSEIKPEYTGNPAGSLAEALATHAFMEDKEAEYAARVGEVFRQRDLYRKIQDEYGIDGGELRSEVIRKAAAKLPESFGEERTRIIEQELVDYPAERGGC